MGPGGFVQNDLATLLIALHADTLLVIPSLPVQAPPPPGSLPGRQNEMLPSLCRHSLEPCSCSDFRPIWQGQGDGLTPACYTRSSCTAQTTPFFSASLAPSPGLRQSGEQPNTTATVGVSGGLQEACFVKQGAQPQDMCHKCQLCH